MTGQHTITDFFTKLILRGCMLPGLYTFTYTTATGVHPKAYADLTAPVTYPAVDYDDHADPESG